MRLRLEGPDCRHRYHPVYKLVCSPSKRMSRIRAGRGGDKRTITTIDVAAELYRRDELRQVGNSKLAEVWTSIIGGAAIPFGGSSAAPWKNGLVPFGRPMRNHLRCSAWPEFRRRPSPRRGWSCQAERLPRQHSYIRLGDVILYKPIFRS